MTISTWKRKKGLQWERKEEEERGRVIKFAFASLLSLSLSVCVPCSAGKKFVPEKVKFITYKSICSKREEE